VFIGIASGSYPALVLTKFSSIDLFQGKFKLSRKNMFSRSLIVFQFSISTFLIVTTVFLYQQHNFMRQRDLGYNQNQVVIVPLSNIPGENTNTSALFASLRDRLLRYDFIEGVSGSQYGLSSYWMATYLEPKQGEKKIVVYNHVDHDFVQTLEMSLLEGRHFSREFPADLHKSILVNEAFVKLLEGKSPVGRNLSEYFTGDFDRQIIGVVKDFHYQSLYDPILPGFMGLVADEKDDYTRYNYTYIKLRENRLEEALANIKKEFQAIAPHTPFTYSFLDEALARLYLREERWSRMVKYASIFAILIACSGLFGLTLLSIARRTKEIGIRKVLGASVAQIIQLVNREFIWLVLAANLIAWPAAYMAISLVFRDYAYRVPLNVWVFLLAGGLALVMAVTTMSIHSLRAARTNPAETLKYE
jgi:ABC-type antimicrobial peptide transport system permease subunit